MQRTAMAAVGLVLAWVVAASGSAQQAGGTEVFVFDDLKTLQGTIDKLEGAMENMRAGARDRAPQGRGVIRGMVTSAATGAPLRGATVRAVFGSGDGGPQSAVTDDNGAFELRGLPTGSWTLSASKSGFVTRNFGQRGPSGDANTPRSGSILTVTDREPVTASIALPRGGAVMGHVFDEFGDPAVGARVQAMQLVATENGRRLMPVGTPDITDDTGAYRVYGLVPGDYVVSARSPSPFDSDVRMIDQMGEKLVFSIDRLEARPIPSGLRQRASTYFPGTSDIGAAERIAIGAGDERAGVDFALVESPMLRIAGTVINSSGDRPTGATMVTLNSNSPDMSATFAMSTPSADGGFDFREVPPGSYNLSVSIPGVRMEMAELPLRVTEDVIGLEVVTAPGVALRGTVESDDRSLLPELRGMLVRALPASGQRQAPAFAGTSGAVIDGLFQVPNLLGTFRLSAERVPVGWILKAIEIDGVDVTDSTVTFKPGERPQATIVLTNRITDLTGVVTNEDRQPVDAAVLIFPDDQAKWLSQRFVRTLRASDDGRFSLRGLPAHDHYLAVATDYVDPNEVRDPEFLDRMRSRATSFSLEGGLARNINLTYVDRSTIDGR